VPQTTFDWEGNEWQEYCLKLLRLRYRQPGEFESVPSSDQGDLGIEGFSHDGCVYQCYSPKGPLPIRERYKRQRDKLAEDVRKLETYQAELMAILGGVPIRLYVFMTPIHDSRRLNCEAKAKAVEVRGKGLPHCSADFDIVIHTEADYPVESSELIALGLHKLHLTPVRVPDTAVSAYVASNPQLIATIDAKLSRLPGSSNEETLRLRTMLLKRKLTADNMLDEIRGHDAVAWERLQALRAAREAALEIECMLTNVDPRDLLTQTAHGYRDTLKEGLAFLHDADASDLAWGTTTDWLAECPLDFRAAAS
jgi:hypothetical protein